MFFAEKTTATTDLNQPVDENVKPVQLALMQNYPNPFNPETLIRFQLPKMSHVSLKIYNLIGQEIVTLINRNISAGSHSVKWDETDMLGLQVSSGIYIYRIEVGHTAQTRKMTLIR
jgi:glucuronoarabinoxylan endo-1,4-beta-xylanase